VKKPRDSGVLGNNKSTLILSKSRYFYGAPAGTRTPDTLLKRQLEHFVFARPSKTSVFAMGLYTVCLPIYQTDTLLFGKTIIKPFEPSVQTKELMMLVYLISAIVYTSILFSFEVLIKSL